MFKAHFGSFAPYILVMLMLGAVISQNIKYDLDTMEVADTGTFVGIRFADTTMAQEIASEIMKYYPLEASFCYYGGYVDTTYVGVSVLGDTAILTRKIAIIESFTIPEVLERKNDRIRGINFIKYVNDDICGTAKENVIGIGHSHPGVLPFSCSHSDPTDVYSFYTIPKLWFSVVYCDGAIQVLWKDGRRWNVRM